MCTPFFNNLKR